MIVAQAHIRFVPRVQGISELRLDLIQLTVDSVLAGPQQLPFTHQAGVLRVDLGQSFGPADTLAIDVHYRGTPATDPSNFGGFYLESTYIYNLGVAFQSQPHSYGRAWFPCFDNFVERCSFEFLVTTHMGRSAWCNGVLQGITPLGGDTLVTHWRMDATIPSYLASVAVANYAAVRDTFPSIGGAAIPVDLVARPQDTTAMKNSFIHLRDAFDAFEGCFGAYAWDRIGYHLASRGAMEHSTNITYPDFIANGNLQYEATMAHELAHQWFGDLVTCERAEEMYINEGFAEYLSFLFLEAVYGHGHYLNVVRANHYDMLKSCHWKDGGIHHALANVPQDHTYGEHSYNKGADVLHTLRSYLGADGFCTGLTSFLDAHAFQAVNSTQLRDHLGAVTGVDLTHFFNDWIFQGGWASFEVDSFFTAPAGGGLWTTTVHVEQKLKGADHYYEQVPVTVTLRAADGGLWDHPDPVMMGGAGTTFSISTPFPPVAVRLNVDDRISLARTAVQEAVTQTGAKNLAQADLTLLVNTLPAPFELRAEQYWVAADPVADPAHLYLVSPDRWWRLEGDPPAGLDMVVRITFDGRPIANGGFDVGLMDALVGPTFREDSLVILYRPNAHFPWAALTSTVNPLGSATDRWGRIEATLPGMGDLTLGRRISATSIPQNELTASTFRVFPVPADERIMVEAQQAIGSGWVLCLSDQRGSVIVEQAWRPGTNELNVSRIPPQVANVVIHGPDGRSLTIGQVVISR